VANVKWLSEIHAQEEQYMGKFQTRWYRTFKGEMIDGEMKWVETDISHMQLKSYIARITKECVRLQRVCRRPQRRHPAQGRRSEESTRVRGGRRPSTRPRAKSTAGSSFNFAWTDATPGTHTVVSRVVDVEGRIQPTVQELENKKSFLEDNSQTPRKVMI
jgi:hypothetical protein